MLKLRYWVIRKLESLLWFFRVKDNEKEMQRRIEVVGATLYEHLHAILLSAFPNKIEETNNLSIIEHGSFNYFEFSDGTLPKFDYACPLLPLYIYIGDPKSATLGYALSSGITYADWEKEQSKIVMMENLIPTLNQTGAIISAKLLVIRWDDPCSVATIVNRLSELFIGT